MRYSVAIRTLGTSLDTLKRELLSLHNQTIMPEKIVIYIANGYKRPDFTVGMEEYVYVKKGMIAQRALQYREIESECILLLDDDVELAPDSAERMLKQLKESKGDCMAADTFRNHEMSWINKLQALIGGWVYPRFDQKWAFKLTKAGSFSYINNPTKDFYPSQSAAGPASLWRKDILLKLRLEDEIWLDELGFAFGDDELEFYKLYINGGKLFVSFNHGINNLDAKTASRDFQADIKKYNHRVLANIVRWYRMNISIGKSTIRKIQFSILCACKLCWLGIIHILLSIFKCNWSIAKNYVSGIKNAISFIKSKTYKQIPSYIIQNDSSCR